MRYLTGFMTMTAGEAVQIVGDASLYTIQNTGPTAAVIQISNDGSNWVDLVTVASNDAETIEHAAAYMKTSEAVSVNRAKNQITIQ